MGAVERARGHCVRHPLTRCALCRQVDDLLSEMFQDEEFLKELKKDGNRN